jgi:hypothetical protein
MGYDQEKGATVVVVTNLYSVPDGSQPAKEITRLIIQELSSTDGEGTEESTNG